MNRRAAHIERTVTEPFLTNACLDWRIGGPERRQRAYAAGRLLRRHPAIAEANIFTAVVAGDLQRVAAMVRARPESASEVGGPRNWPPLLYLCAARLAATDGWSADAVSIARLLLEHDADPNVFYEGGNPSIHYTALTCVIGRGEEHAAQHPRARELAALLLEHDAEPYDIQVLYNGFGGHTSLPDLADDNLVWLLDLIHAHALRRGRQQDWRDADWTMLSMGGYGCGAWYLLSSALSSNNLPIAEWALAHGANPDPPRAADTRTPPHSLYARAVLGGQHDFAELLARFGAPRTLPAVTERESFLDACFQLDRTSVQAAIARNAQLLHDPAPMLAAAARDRADVVRLLLDVGVSPDVHTPEAGVRPLHTAAFNGARQVVRLLIERGAQVDPRDQTYGTTPIAWAYWGGREASIDLLAPHTRDVWVLTPSGRTDRLRALLEAEPALAAVRSDNHTLLFHLPDDEGAAAEIARLLLAHGADASVQMEDGMTALALARLRGLDEAASLLDAAGAKAPPSP